jgi:uncharacterized phage-associated protein
MANYTFNAEVALEAILYIANRVDNPTFHRISKILYFADKAHLVRYGRFISGDSYVAMKHGPAPSDTYDILKAVRFGLDYCYEVAPETAFSVDNYMVIPFRAADLDVFSDSDIECLDEAITLYGTKTFGELTRLSHDEAWNATGDNEFMDIELIAATLNDADLLEHLQDPYP